MLWSQVAYRCCPFVNDDSISSIEPIALFCMTHSDIVPLILHPTNNRKFEIIIQRQRERGRGGGEREREKRVTVVATLSLFINTATHRLTHTVYHQLFINLHFSICKLCRRLCENLFSSPCPYTYWFHQLLIYVVIHFFTYLHLLHVHTLRIHVVIGLFA